MNSIRSRLTLSSDMNREISPLRQAEDAVLVDASFMGIEEVTAAVIAEFEKKKQA